jgi:DNA-binding CsgD family transcriptional regulator
VSDRAADTAAVSEREAEVLEAIGAHLSNAQIAGRMHISVRTVESHVSSLLRKFGVPDRRALADLAPVVMARQRTGTGMVVGLPAARTSFIGRSAEQAGVLAALEDSRLVTLLGPGGVGKTRMAARVAEVAAGRYPLGAVFTDLVPVREGFVTEAVAALLGVTEGPGRSLDAALHEYLARGPSLLVLDNCEHLLEVAAAFIEKLLADCADLTVLATSRERLAIPGERMVPLPPLSLIAGETGGTAGSEAEAPGRPRWPTRLPSPTGSPGTSPPRHPMTCSATCSVRRPGSHRRTTRSPRPTWRPPPRGSPIRRSRSRIPRWWTARWPPRAVPVTRC